MKIKREFKLGITITLSLAALFWGINFLKGENIFTTDNNYICVYEKVDGLRESSPIMMYGYNVGIVGSIELLHSQNKHGVLVELQIDDEINLPKGSIAKIFSSDLMGTKAIKIVPGDEQAIHQNGDTLLTEIEKDLMEEVSVQMLPLKKQAEGLMKELEEVLVVIKYVFNEKTLDNLSHSFESIKTTLANLENTTQTMDNMMTTEQKRINAILKNAESITNNLANNNGKITNIISNFSHISDSLAKADFATIIKEAGSSLAELNGVLEKVNQGEGSLGALLHNDTLYYNLENASKNLDNLLIDVQKNPKKYIRFSVMDFGRTVYEVKDKKEAKKIKAEHKAEKKKK